MESVLMDTSVWIDAFQGKTPEVATITRKLLVEDRVMTCGPILFELNRGLRSSERKRILPFFSAVNRLPFEESVWEAAGDLDASLRRTGITIPPMDILIAMISLHHNIVLFTLDNHFLMIPGLKLFQP